MNTTFFNAHHSPIGAFASLTLGRKGAAGGFGIEIGGPAQQSVYFGVEGKEKGDYFALPFFSQQENYGEQFGLDQQQIKKHCTIQSFPDSAVTREYELCSDTWRAGDIKVSLYSTVEKIPDPAINENASELERVLLPAVTAEFTINNRSGTSVKTGFAGFTGNDPYHGMRHIQCNKRGLKGIGIGRHAALLTNAKNTRTLIGFSAEEMLTDAMNGGYCGGLGNTALLLFQVPPGNAATFRLAFCFFREGTATSGIDTTYWYRRHFSSIEAVGEYAFQHFPIIKKRAGICNGQFSTGHLSDDRKFMLIHAIRSYYGSTQLLDNDGKPVWVVNEGEYRMINTLDLAVDHLFYEMTMHPWAVKNILDMYVEKYSYRDLVMRQGSNAKHNGGISFTHDMGVANVFAPRGTSAYEHERRDGCFSFMTHEELVNWVIMAGVYSKKQNDTAWLENKRKILHECFNSLLNRDHAEPEKRDGVSGTDSTRVNGGKEITTYDSLDASLGQARANSYVAVKRWAAFVLLNEIFLSINEPTVATEAMKNAELVAATLALHVNEFGLIPALLDGSSDACTFSLIEGLVYPWFAGCREYYREENLFHPFIELCKKHCISFFKQGLCRTSDNGWKLSSTSTVTWASKLYIFRYILTEIFNAQNGEAFTAADTVHCSWLFDDRNNLYAWSDQIRDGVVIGSRYYPRGVTSILWTMEK